MPGRPGFFAELKRRHVWRVATAYAVVGWLFVQLASIVFPAFGTPAWALQTVIVLLVIAFPFAMVLAWAFEITPDGIRRTEPASSPDARAERDARLVGRRLDGIIIAVLVLAVGLLLANTFVWHKGMRDARVAAHVPGPAAAPAPGHGAAHAQPAPAIPAKSIAVLPFENLSSDKNNEYFVAGMQDLILTKLADIGDLKVISRTSTMHYRSRPGNLRQVAAELGVATVLEGSVQKQGNQVLISVQLIDAQSDAHLWAASYTRTLDNVFGVEGEVAQKIAVALQARLPLAEAAQLAAAPTTNQAAYDLFLRAEYLAIRGDVDYDTASWKAAIPLYQQAIAQDSRFALAHARLSWVESILAWWGGGGEDPRRLVAQARVDAERAMQLAPNVATSQIAIGYSDYYGKRDYATALKAFDAALALRPNDAEALAARGYVERRLGRFDEAIVSLQQALAHDPRNSKRAYEIGWTYMMVDRYGDAETWLQRALALDPNNLAAKSYYSYAILVGSGDVPRAMAAVAGDDPALKLERVYLLGLQRRYPDAIGLLSGIPDTPDNFQPWSGSKSLQLARLYQLAGDQEKARPLYADALAKARAQLAVQQGYNLANAWQSVAGAELGLGHSGQGVDAVGHAQALVAGMKDQSGNAKVMVSSAGLYAEANRPDLAVPLLARALATPGIGNSFSPVLLWLEPGWDPIRRDPRFQALLKQYAKYKPTVTYDPAPARGTPTSTHQ